MARVYPSPNFRILGQPAAAGEPTRLPAGLRTFPDLDLVDVRSLTGPNAWSAIERYSEWLAKSKREPALAAYLDAIVSVHRDPANWTSGTSRMDPEFVIETLRPLVMDSAAALT